MSDITYLDFDVEIQPRGKGFISKVLNSPAGQASAPFRVPFNHLELENFLLRLGRPRRGLRASGCPAPGGATIYGGRLFEALFHNDVLTCLSRSLDEARNQQHRLRVRLRLTDAPRLIELPWEYLYDAGQGRFLALSPDTALVRYLAMAGSPPPLTVTAPLRVLVMIASPSDYAKLDAAQEWDKLTRAVGKLQQRGLVILEQLPTATLRELQQRLRQRSDHCQVFHFIGHGSFDAKTRDGVLVLVNGRGRGDRVSGQALGAILQGYRPLRLAILNACEGARTSPTDTFAGTAQVLVRQGVPAVVAMQFEITDEAAITFAEEFYSSLADNYPVDAALTEARRAIYAQDNNSWEWGTPVLYMRSADSRLFHIQSPPPTPAPEGQLPSPQPVLSQPPPSPDGTMDPDSPFYIEWPADRDVRAEALKQGGVTITIKGPRQAGKSTLLERAIQAALQAGKRVARVDFQQFDSEVLKNEAVFFRQFCAAITDQLQMEDRVENYFDGGVKLGNIQRCTRYLSNYLLKELSSPLVLAMDEVERVIDTPFQTDYFGMLRLWHNNRRPGTVWKRLDLYLVTSTEPNAFIKNPYQSPFNVSLRFDLDDFRPEQVAELNRRYGSRLDPAALARVIDMLGGHPYLVHQTIYLVYTQRHTLDECLADPRANAHPFGQHLRAVYQRLQNYPELLKGLRGVISGRGCQEDIAYRLRSMGLVRWADGIVVPRCRLYADYFRGQLNG
jgi:CHAT domain-containing protein